MKKYLKLITIIAFVNVLFAGQVFAKELVLTSKGKNAIFIELFTSQGCSSCPPAEKYINTYSSNDKLWEKYIPIVFHVDYWDYIGWKDIFAKAEFGQRQRQYANLKKVRTVYTPAFVVDGAAWRRGFFGSVPQVKGLSNGELNVTVSGRQIQSQFNQSSALSENLTMNVALLGMDMVVDIEAGERDGSETKHSFIVLGYSSQYSKNQQWQMPLPKMKTHPTSTRYAIVAWVSEPNNPTPIQAVAGWIDNPNP